MFADRCSDRSRIATPQDATRQSSVSYCQAGRAWVGIDQHVIDDEQDLTGVECTEVNGKLSASFSRPAAGAGTAVSFEEGAPVRPHVHISYEV